MTVSDKITDAENTIIRRSTSPNASEGAAVAQPHAHVPTYKGKEDVPIPQVGTSSDFNKKGKVLYMILITCLIYSQLLSLMLWKLLMVHI